LDKLKLKTQLPKPLSRPYLLHWVVGVEAVEVLEAVVPALEVAVEALLEVAVEEVR
jgi:hypothetical protein